MASLPPTKIHTTGVKVFESARYREAPIRIR